MPSEKAEQMLGEWAIVTRDRETRVRAAVAAGLTKHRIHLLTGIDRSAIDRILAAMRPLGPSMAMSMGHLMGHVKFGYPGDI
jgi:hypothetical protein